MNKSIALLGTLAALALAGSSANAATTIPLGTFTSNGYFFITAATPGDTDVTANFGAAPAAGSNFDDLFTFTLPLSGTGSGSASTSFSGAGNKLVISSVVINGTSYSAAMAAAGISSVPITAGMLNTIEVIGTAGSIVSTFSGTATFTATAVPEPATWATFLLGFGFMGFALRRKLAGKLATA